MYRCAIEMVAFSASISARMPKGFSSLTEQLRRAALSVPLNIAEAAGRNTDADAARHYAIAPGSAMEFAALIDTLRVLDALDEPAHASALELASRVVAMDQALSLRSSPSPSPSRSPSTTTTTSTPTTNVNVSDFPSLSEM